MTWGDPLGGDDLVLEVRRAKADAIASNPKESIRQIEAEYRFDKSKGFRAFYAIIDNYDLQDWPDHEKYIFDFDNIGDIEGDLIINNGHTLRATWKGETLDWLTYEDFHDGRDDEGGVYNCPYIYSVFMISCSIYDAYTGEENAWIGNIGNWSYDKAGNYVISWILSKYIECLISHRILICVKRSWKGDIWVPVTEKDISENLQFFYYENAESRLPFFRAHSDLPPQPFEYRFLRARDAPDSMVKKGWRWEYEDEIAPVDPVPSRSSGGPLSDSDRRREAVGRMELERVCAENEGMRGIKADALAWLDRKFGIKGRAADRVWGNANLPGWKVKGKPSKNNRIDFKDIN